MSEAILSFSGRVNLAVRKVQEQYPDAIMFEAMGTSSQGPVTDPNSLDKIKVVFYKPEGAHIVIESTGFSEFGEPELIQGFWVGDVLIEWPPAMDLPEANMLKESAGFTGAYNSVVLRQPFGPKSVNPYYIFGISAYSPFVFVDTVTKEVFEAAFDGKSTTGK